MGLIEGNVICTNAPFTFLYLSVNAFHKFDLSTAIIQNFSLNSIPASSQYLAV